MNLYFNKLITIAQMRLEKLKDHVSDHKLDNKRKWEKVIEVIQEIEKELGFDKE